MITKALVGDEVYLRADVQDLPDGTSVTIKIVEKDSAGRKDDEIATLTASVQEGKIECNWKVVYTEDGDDAESKREKAEKGYTLPEYAFTAECGDVISEESAELDVFGWIKTQFKDKKTGKLIANRKYTIYLLDGTTIKGVTDNDGYVDIKYLKQGEYFISFER